ncbi:hypothetical protein [Occallatibacter riparius]|uniref:Uncharacterized protein n=1 Tax=Occallatibacter riparius TaxID=1002689 RepID=A0A9J7BLE0_9BACT|nr:hypothetical protein [Occallatibacter riparius]UWZ81702.1 hypothetical protein MOP44_14025 [Occallatibacter riparius]
MRRAMLYGGGASIAPDLTQLWTQGTQAQKDLDTRWSPARIPALEASSQPGFILARDTKADLACPYANEQIKICRLPQPASEAQLR